jgi:hypothetical protein
VGKFLDFFIFSFWLLRSDCNRKKSPQYRTVWTIGYDGFDNFFTKNQASKLNSEAQLSKIFSFIVAFLHFLA